MAMKLKLKKKKLYDEYVLTNKHIICKFKYLVICLDHPDDLDLSAGLIHMDKNELCQLLTEQTVELTNATGNFWQDAVTQLKQWHPQICKIEIDPSEAQQVTDLQEYSESYCMIYESLQQIPANRCVRDDSQMTLLTQLSHVVMDVKVYFQLVRKITKIEEYKVNFNYLRGLLSKHIAAWNQMEVAFLEEMKTDLKHLPYASLLQYTSDEDDGVCYVYPQMYLLPLY